MLRALKLAGLSVTYNLPCILSHVRGQHAVTCCAVLTCSQGGAIFAGGQAEVLVTRSGFLKRWGAFKVRLQLQLLLLLLMLLLLLPIKQVQHAAGSLLLLNCSGQYSAAAP
jgi:hypothetical protein